MVQFRDPNGLPVKFTRTPEGRTELDRPFERSIPRSASTTSQGRRLSAWLGKHGFARVLQMRQKVRFAAKAKHSS
jgi:hypothetical protein